MPGIDGRLRRNTHLDLIFALIDILFIFSDDRRCIHDHIAGTVVIDAR